MIRTIVIAVLLSVSAIAWAAPQAPADVAGNIAAQRKEADKLFDQGKLDEAKVIYARIASSYAKDFDFNMHLAYCYFVSKTNEMARAAIYYGRAHALRPKNVEAEMNWGKTLSWSKQYPKAIEVLQGIVTRDPANREALLELARAQNYSKDVTSANANYAAYLKRWPGDAQVRAEYAQWLSWNKRYDEALENYRTLRKDSPRDASLMAGEAQVLAWKGDLQSAMQLYDQALARSPGLYEALRGRAYVLLWQQKFDEAEKAFAQANKRRRPDAEVKQAMGTIAKWKADEPERQRQAKLDVYLRPAGEAVTRGDFPAAIELFRKALALEPDNVDIRFRLAEACLWDRRWNDAITIFTALHSEHPDDANFVRELGHAYTGARQLDQAIDLLRGYLKTKPDPTIHLELAQVLSWTGKLDESIPEFQAVLTQQPDNFEAALGLAYVTAWQGHSAEALAQFEKLLQQHPANREAQLGHAQVLAWSGHADQALPLLGAMAKERPNDREIATVLESVRDSLRQQEAEQRMAAAGPEPLQERIRRDEASLKDHPNDAKLIGRIADGYAELKNYKDAVSNYDKALALTPKDADLLLRTARVTSWNRDFARSIDLYQQLIVVQDKPEYRLEMARVLSWAGRNRESIAEYRALLKQNPDDVSVRLGLARVLTWDKQSEDALAEYDLVLKKDPQNRDALFERARTYAWKGDYKTALQMYDSILIHAPHDNDVLLAKAQALNWSGQPHQASSILEDLQKSHPENRDVTLANAAVQSSLGRADVALRLLNSLDKLQPGNHDVESLRESIENGMRPVLIVGFTPSFDSGDTAIYASRATFYFSPHPQVRSYVSVNLIPSFVPNTFNAETGKEFLFGSYGRVNSRLQLRGEIGADASNAGNPSPIGSAGATVFATDKIQFEFDVSRRFINYLPRPISLGISRMQYRAAWNWRANSRTTFHVDYYHESYSDKNANDGGNISVLENLLNRERVKVQAGYLFAISAFDHAGNSGFFTPTSFTRHAGLGNTQVKLSKATGISFWGSLGREEVFDQAFRWDGTARASWDYQVTPKIRSSLGYGYFAVSSIGGSTAYVTHTMYSSVQYTF